MRSMTAREEVCSNLQRANSIQKKQKIHIYKIALHVVQVTVGICESQLSSCNIS